MSKATLMHEVITPALLLDIRDQLSMDGMPGDLHCSADISGGNRNAARKISACKAGQSAPFPEVARPK